jgi:threonine synthase
VYRDVARTRANEHWVLVATAHPAKFNEIVEPLIGRPVPIPPQLDRLLRLPCQESELEPTLDALKTELTII